ncbi:MAG: hypothetical protein JSU03_08240 [Bacteroidetes bacterium]|nr:hypothetical protein [Bacteroidota bacterium]MBS1757252.1 hypothetical protein [Bacteroidota bacterium]
MALKNNILILLHCIGVNLLLLLAAAILDIIITVLMIGYSFQGATITCFAVVGVFSGTYCYSQVIDRTNKENREKVSLYVLIWVALLCGFLFTIFAPLSGGEYNWPVKLFAVTELVVFIFFRIKKFRMT